MTRVRVLVGPIPEGSVTVGWEPQLLDAPPIEVIAEAILNPVRTVTCADEATAEEIREMVAEHADLELLAEKPQASVLAPLITRMGLVNDQGESS
jgi:hypothetical protein